MNYAIVYSSRTRNTAQLAQRIKRLLPPESIVYYGPPAAEAMQADVLFVGSWTDKGTCSLEIAQFLSGLKNKQVYLFGMAGFGGSPDYFAQIEERIAQNLPSGNVLLGYYFCQGKMPQAVRTRYEAMAKTDPEKGKRMLNNFDQALSHPDQEDLRMLEKAVSHMLKNISSN